MGKGKTKTKVSKGPKENLKPLPADYIAAMRFAGNLSFIASHVQDCLPAELEGVMGRKPKKDDFLFALGQTLDAIENADTRAKELKGKHSEEWQQRVKEVLIVLDMMYGPIRMGHWDIYHLDGKKQGNSICKEFVKAYENASQHSLRLNELSSRLAVEAEEFAFPDAGRAQNDKQQELLTTADLHKGLTLRKFLCKCCGIAEQIEAKYGSIYARLNRYGKAGDIAWPLQAVTREGKPKEFKHRKDKFKFYRLDALLYNWPTYCAKTDGLPPLTTEWSQHRKNFIESGYLNNHNIPRQRQQITDNQN